MKKNQPLNIQRRHLLAWLPHYAAAGAVVFAGLKGGLHTQIAKASEQSLIFVPANGSLPDLVVKSDAGEKRLSSLADQHLVINFWATWCAPCVAELPTLEAAAGILAADNIKLVLISMDRGGPAVARPFLQERGVSTPLSLYDPQAQHGDTARARSAGSDCGRHPVGAHTPGNIRLAAADNVVIAIADCGGCEVSHV